MAINNVKPFELLSEYERLSLSHSVEQVSEVQEKGSSSGVGFKLDEQRWVVPINNIEEVLILTETTKIPGIASWVLGLGNIRGNLIPVIDFKAFITGKPIKTTPHTRMVVINQLGGQVGLVVDEVFGQRHFNSSQIIENDEKYNFLKRTYQDESGVWNQLDVEMLINDSSFQNAAAI